jgi:hypothetical protein
LKSWVRQKQDSGEDFSPPWNEYFWHEYWAQLMMGGELLSLLHQDSRILSSPILQSLTLSIEQRSRHSFSEEWQLPGFHGIELLLCLPYRYNPRVETSQQDLRNGGLRLFLPWRRNWLA